MAGFDFRMGESVGKKKFEIEIELRADMEVYGKVVGQPMM